MRSDFYMLLYIHVKSISALQNELNKEEPVMWNTIQAFLRGSKVALENELEISRENSFHYGVKLVRGAYIEGERLLAERHNWPNPVWPTKSQTRVSARARFQSFSNDFFAMINLIPLFDTLCQNKKSFNVFFHVDTLPQTDENYDDLAKMLISEASESKLECVLAGHNEKSILLAIDQLNCNPGKCSLAPLLRRNFRTLQAGSIRTIVWNG